MYSVFTYSAAIWSVYDSLSSSVTFLQTTIKLCEGVNLIILGNFCLLNGVLLWKLLTRLLFGELRLIEYEHVFERLSFTIVNSIFVSSMFKEQDFLTVLVFTAVLIFLKVFHWILKDRLEFVFQNANENTNLKKMLFSRFNFNLLLLASVDYQMVRYCFSNSISNDQWTSSSVYLMFGIDFAMLLVDTLSIGLHGVVNFVEVYRLQSHNSHDDEEFLGLEGKFMYEKLIDMGARLLKMLLHIALLIPFRMPIMIIKDIIWDAISLYQTATSLWKTWKNAKKLDEKLPDVTEEELNQGNNMCIVCMDDMLPNSETRNANLKPKKLPCGHILHLSCLKSWMERSQTCPICRLPVFDERGNVTRMDSSSQEQHVPHNLQRQEAEGEVVQVTTSPFHTTSASVGPTSTTQTQANRSVIMPQVPRVPQDWYAFPIEATQTTKDKVVFKLVDSDNNEITANLLTKTRPQFQKVTEVSGDQRITIPQSCIEQKEEIESLKRKISEMENKLDALTKRVRTE